MAVGIPNNNFSNLSQEQILQRTFIEVNDRLRVDAQVTAEISELISNADDSDIAIRDPLTDNSLKINTDGSIDANVKVDAAEKDSILVVGTENGNVNGTQRVMKVDASGNSMQIQRNTLVPYEFDAIYPSTPDEITEQYIYKKNGATVATVTITYSDSSKTSLVSIVRT
jgi:hypothetical protein